MRSVFFPHAFSTHVSRFEELRGLEKNDGLWSGRDWHLRVDVVIHNNALGQVWPSGGEVQLTEQVVNKEGNKWENVILRLIIQSTASPVHLCCSVTDLTENISFKIKYENVKKRKKNNTEIQGGGGDKLGMHCSHGVSALTWLGPRRRRTEACRTPPPPPRLRGERQSLPEQISNTPLTHYRRVGSD